MILYILSDQPTPAIRDFTDIVLITNYRFSDIIGYDQDKTLMLKLYNCMLYYNTTTVPTYFNFVKWDNNIMSKQYN